MIKLIKTGYCEGCELMEPELIKVLKLNPGLGDPFSLDVRCKHENLCLRLEKYISDRMAEANAPDLEELDI